VLEDNVLLVLDETGSVLLLGELYRRRRQGQRRRSIEQRACGRGGCGSCILHCQDAGDRCTARRLRDCRQLTLLRLQHIFRFPTANTVRTVGMVARIFLETAKRSRVVMAKRP